MELDQDTIVELAWMASVKTRWFGSNLFPKTASRNPSGGKTSNEFERGD